MGAISRSLRSPGFIPAARAQQAVRKSRGTLPVVQPRAACFLQNTLALCARSRQILGQIVQKFAAIAAMYAMMDFRGGK
jgi:hypothetical protein